MKIISIIAVAILVLFVQVDAQTSPKVQLEQGIAPNDITCKDQHTLVLRASGTPACVTPQTASILEQRGWSIIKDTSQDIQWTVQNDLLPDEPSQPVQESIQEHIQNQPIPSAIATSQIQTIPASSSTTLNLYIIDQDLNLAQGAAETVSTQGLLEITINGVQITPPQTMIETGLDTGKFLVQAKLPETINGEPLQQDDVVLVRYLDQSDRSGNSQILTKSFVLSSTQARLDSSGGGSSRIGHEFTVRIYEPDANRDSRDEDKIPLRNLEYRGEGGIRTTLANSKFDANSSSMIETGPNTGTFEVKIKIPRQIDGKTVHIGDWYEIRYIDKTTPSGDEEKIILKGRIG